MSERMDFRPVVPTTIVAAFHSLTPLIFQRTSLCRLHDTRRRRLCVAVRARMQRVSSQPSTTRRQHDPSRGVTIEGEAAAGAREEGVTPAATSSPSPTTNHPHQQLQQQQQQQQQSSHWTTLGRWPMRLSITCFISLLITILVRIIVISVLSSRSTGTTSSVIAKFVVTILMDVGYIALAVIAVRKRSPNLLIVSVIIVMFCASAALPMHEDWDQDTLSVLFLPLVLIHVMSGTASVWMAIRLKQQYYHMLILTRQAAAAVIAFNTDPRQQPEPLVERHEATLFEAMQVQ